MAGMADDFMLATSNKVPRLTDATLCYELQFVSYFTCLTLQHQLPVCQKARITRNVWCRGRTACVLQNGCAETATDQWIGSRGRLPYPAIAGYYEGEAQGSRNWAQSLEEKE